MILVGLNAPAGRSDEHTVFQSDDRVHVWLPQTYQRRLRLGLRALWGDVVISRNTARRGSAYETLSPMRWLPTFSFENHERITGNAAMAAASPALTSSLPAPNVFHSTLLRFGVSTRSLACRQADSPWRCMIWKHRRTT